MTAERVQKLIARAGVCSRREADRMVAEGRVTVNGRVASPGESADPAIDHIKVDGKMLRSPEELRYVLLYKPREVMTTCDDPEGRRTVLDLVRPVVAERVFPVGRLDYHSEGLLLLTNDGDLAARVLHPRYAVEREYLAKIRGDLDQSELDKLMRGALVEGQHVKPVRAGRERVARDGRTSWWRVVVTEGRTHEVRELFFRCGHHVQRLRRVAIGPLRDDRLGPGDFRFLTERELADLRRLLSGPRRGGGASKSPAPSPRPPRPAPGRRR